VIAFDDARSALRLTAALASAGIVLVSIRHVSLWRWYTPNGVYPWRFPDERPSSRGARIAAVILEHPGLTLLLALRGGSAIWTIVAASAAGPLGMPVTILLITTLVKKWRLRLMGDEAEVMSSVVLFALAFHAWRPHDQVVAEIVAWFIAAQLCLAYFGAGLAKLDSPAWRRGDALARLFAGSALRNPALADWLLRHPVAGRLASHAAIGLQLGFWIGLLVPPALPVFLAAGFLFHLGIGLALGLWSFLWAFVAAYPAAVFVASRVSRALWT
jgi:hypothetical protein